MGVTTGGDERDGDDRAPLLHIRELRASKVVLKCKLRDTRSGRVLAGDGSEGGAAAYRVRSAWITKNSVVQQIEVFSPEFQAGFAENREVAGECSVPNSEAGATKRILDHISKDSSVAGVGGHGEGRGLETGL